SRTAQERIAFSVGLPENSISEPERESSCLVSAYGGGRAHCLTSRKLSHHSLISHHSLHRISKS
ncbi:hypothetical protein RJ639_028955, partial [Escallonia herrerae]